MSCRPGVAAALLLVLAPVATAIPAAGASGGPPATASGGPVTAATHDAAPVATDERASVGGSPVGRASIGRVQSAPLYRLNVSVDPLPDRENAVRVTVVARRAGDGPYGVQLGPAVEEVGTTSGFVQDSTAERVWKLDTGRQRGSITFVARASLTETNGSTWAVLDQQRLFTALFPTGAPPTVRVRGGNDRTAAAQGTIYVGEPVVHERTVEGLALRVVAERGTADADSPGRVVEAIRAGRERLDIGGRNDRLTVFVKPERAGGPPGRSTFGGRSLWVAAGTGLVRTSLYHEHVHTRQTFATTDETRWLVEASARYLSTRLAYERCHYDYRRFRARLNPQGAGADTLADPGTWSSPGTPYAKGSRVLAVLDARIRNETGGERSFETVVRRLQGENVTRERFERTVETVAGRPLNEFFDRYVYGDEVPPKSAIPAAPTAFGFAERCGDETGSLEPEGPTGTPPDPGNLTRRLVDGTPLKPFAGPLAGLVELLVRLLAALFG